jgi:nicotinic acid mononucleotide adenylyltransferase
MFIQKDKSRKDIIANLLKSCQTQDFFTTWTSTIHWPASSSNFSPCRLLILDSSFNPPTKAHANLMAKALSSKPPHYFDASLLLFSTVNADKKLTGASVLQRAQMMELMANQFQHSNIAVGFTPHAKFINKAKAIQAWFKNNPIELYFILGYDTIIRLFDPKYYAPVSVKEALAPFFDNHCHIICADRGAGQEDEEKEAFWKGISQEYQADLIHRIELDSTAQIVSSTLARSLLSQDDSSKLGSVLDSDIIQFIRQEKMYE